MKLQAILCFCLTSLSSHSLSQEAAREAAGHAWQTVESVSDTPRGETRVEAEMK